MWVADEMRPSRLRRHPEDVERAVLVGILGIGAFAARGLELGVLLFEGVRDVLEEDQPEHDVLVLGGIHAPAEGISCLPELGFEPEVGPGFRALSL